MAINHNNNWLRLCLQRPLVLIILFALVTLGIFTIQQNIALDDDDDDDNPDHPSRSFLSHDTHQYQPHRDRHTISQKDIDALSLRIVDLKRIKSSVITELKALQKEKIKILKDRASLMLRNDKILTQINKSKTQLKQLELDITANKRQRAEHICTDVDTAPLVFNPMISLDINNYSFPVESITRDEVRGNSAIVKDRLKLNFSRCSLTREFKFNLSSSTQSEGSSSEEELMEDQINFEQPLQSHRRYTYSDVNVCLTVILYRNTSLFTKYAISNNLIINLSGRAINHVEQADSKLPKNFLFASPIFKGFTFRRKIDLVIPSIFQAPNKYDSIIGSLPSFSPIERKYFASFFGEQEESSTTITKPNPGQMTAKNILQAIHRSSTEDLFLFIYDCGPKNNLQCYNEREKMIELSTFLIIVPHQDYDIDQNTNDLIYLALLRGAIPVIVGNERVILPFDEVLDWRRASILLPTARLPEIHFILKSIQPADLYSLKYHGRRIFEHHLATTQQIADTIISLVSLERLNFPPPAIEGVETSTYVPSEKLNIDTNCSLVSCQEARTDSMLSFLSAEMLGPREVSFPSAAYLRNFSLVLSHSYDLWNKPLFSPFFLTPSNPSDPVAPSEFKFLSSNNGYRPINNGLGGSGIEFSQALGGDHPNEQFTIVIITYERITLLMRTLERLKGLAYLNKILVVWNGVNQKPRDDLIWPDVGVPIILVKVDRNSLNNRFLPYDTIETDAIFSMDDDSPLRPDEIVFAFRVWRQSRDRIVGFPGRFHAFDDNQGTWMYNSNHSCELSMVLTGGAFFHKYYTYVYTLLMPEPIRAIVDKFMNCEDIAMNFLVAHLTRKPPIKVTSRWTFHCSTCSTSLSEDETHFMERHECLNIFSAIYGYMPLLNTQHRSDSILFKTRLPKDKQKCFKFV